MLRGSIGYLFSGTRLLFNSGVEEGKINSQSSSQSFLSPKCLLVLLVLNSVLVVFIKVFNNTADISFMVYGMNIGGTFGYFITFGQAFPSFHLRRGKVGGVKEERWLDMDNISDSVTSSISLLTTPWAAIRRGTWFLGFGVTMRFSMLLTLQSLDFLPTVTEQW